MMTAVLVVVGFILLGVYVVEREIDSIATNAAAANERRKEMLSELSEIRGSIERLNNTILKLWGCPDCSGTGDASVLGEQCQTCGGTGRRESQ